MSNRVALIAGVSGMCGLNMAQMLNRIGGWKVVGVSRNRPDVGDWLHHIPVDLLNADACGKAFDDVGDVTHIFYTGLLNGQNLDEENELNTRMFVNFLDAALPRIRDLQHVHVLEGAKWYGYHLGSYKTPAREDDPPCRPAYFYEAQHEHVLKHQRGQSWGWSTTRPGAVCGYGEGARINLMTVVAVYASILRELGMPLHFPGDEATFDAITFATDVGLLNRAMLWASTDPRARDQAFNIANGDAFRWRHMWPRIAAMFDMEPGEIRPIKLSEFMADKGPLWAGMIERYDLKKTDLFRLLPWTYGDAVFYRRWDNLLSTVKANRYGFTEMIDTEEMMARIFEGYRDARLIPGRAGRA